MSGSDPNYITSMEHFESMTHEQIYAGTQQIDAAEIARASVTWLEAAGTLATAFPLTRASADRVMNSMAWEGAAAEAAYASTRSFAASVDELSGILGQVGARLGGLAAAAEAVKVAVVPPGGSGPVGAIARLLEAANVISAQLAQEALRQEAVLAMNMVYKPAYSLAGTGVPALPAPPVIPGLTDRPTVTPEPDYDPPQYLPPSDATPDPEPAQPDPTPSEPQPAPSTPQPSPEPTPSTPQPNPEPEPSTPQPSQPEPSPTAPQPAPPTPQPEPSAPAPQPNSPAPQPEPSPTAPQPAPPTPQPEPNTPAPQPEPSSPTPQPAPVSPAPEPTTPAPPPQPAPATPEPQPGPPNQIPDAAPVPAPALPDPGGQPGVTGPIPADPNQPTPTANQPGLFP
ncbi:hypothetical protein ACFVMC_15955 [Nocardia sp. NPDC127579]|uniref:hypothetical protein n=1 Tax=Nocardia sp. NPDC127579 TaxID=3345402 RepID=UPI0036340F5E